MADDAGWPGRLALTTARDEALEGADYVLVQLRVGGQAARLVDETLPPRFGTIGQETTGAGGLREGAAHGAGRPRHRRGDGPPCRARGMAHRFHEPGRHRDPGAPRRRAPGDRAVQRRDRPPAAPGPDARRRAGADRARARRAQPPDVGPRGPRRWRRSAACAARHATPRRWLAWRASRRTCCARSAPCPRPTCATTTARRGPRGAAGRRSCPGVRGRAPSRPASSRCTAIRRCARSPRCSPSGAAPSTAKRPRSSSHRSMPGPATSRSSTRPTAGRCPASPTTRSSRCRRASTVTAPIRCRRRRSRPRCSGSSSTPRRTSGSRSRRRCRAIARVALRALLANPLIGRYPLASALLDALLDANRAHLPRFSPAG